MGRDSRIRKTLSIPNKDNRKQTACFPVHKKREELTMKKKCEQCGVERSRLNSVYNDKTGGYEMLCQTCAMKVIKKGGGLGI